MTRVPIRSLARSLLPPLALALALTAAPAARAADKIALCHLPPDNPANVQSLLVGARSAAAHMALHGDFQIGVPCSEGVGECEVVGTTVCVAGDDVCTASPLAPPPESPETSCDDGLDNDCDGEVDANDPDCQCLIEVLDSVTIPGDTSAWSATGTVSSLTCTCNEVEPPITLGFFDGFESACEDAGGTGIVHAMDSFCFCAR